MITKMKKILLVSILFILLGSAYSYGVTIVVPDQYAVIQDAVNAATAGDTVLVNSGTYDQGDIVMKDGVNLMGQGFKIVTILGKITTSSNATLSWLTVQNNGDDSAIDIAGIDFNIDYCAVKNLSSDNIGVGININPSSGNINIKRTVVYVGGHTAYDRGICLNNAGPINIENVTVHIAANPSASLPEETACVYSNGSTYTLRNNILTLSYPMLNAICANTDTPNIFYNCILGKLSPITLNHKGTIFASPSYIDAANGDFRLVQTVEPAMGQIGKSSTIALDSGDPTAEIINDRYNGKELQLADIPEAIAAGVNNKAVDLGGYGNTLYTVKTTFRGDFNLLGDINSYDCGPLSYSYGSSVGEINFFRIDDYTDDGKIDFYDLAVFSKLYNASIW